ncbi:maleylpyruvate isomerase family mycothiol-dependent enzyme [Streptomyces sp. NBC_01381]|uniref:maleylpyruvate isomerase family mycothiol-dependent enzyme n=1 Tax=Streptomyces sp. NBC_01381 TaxID=2903845 RepID=UPI00224D387F|nr:maleylpyruvate isomerase family mycothiol-dependent enzyme [Streptomyces sp. NBC_01381]MCX4668151.1 maleylpyruvate isomerase family mycothiol-dependent enzyme [Streptomyces sp. NBC_01381]
MTTDHEAIRELLGAWSFGALMPGDERVVAPHLADCELCAAEAARLRAAVRDLDGPPLPAGPAPARRALAGALGARAAAPRTAAHAAPYAAAVAGLQALLAELDEHGPWGTPVVHDWDVHDTVAHLIAADGALAVRLGLATGASASPSVSVDGTPWRAVWAARTADALSRERRRAPADTVADWRAQSAALLSSPAAHDPELAGRAATLMGVRLPLADHFRVRAFETWVHADDIGRALDKPVPPPLADHLWQLVRLAVRMLDRAVGASAEPVALTVSGEGRAVEWVLGSQDEPVAAEVVLDPVDFCLLLGGRSDPAQVPRGVAGDEAAADRLLNRASVLSWL